MQKIDKSSFVLASIKQKMKAKIKQEMMMKTSNKIFWTLVPFALSACASLAPSKESLKASPDCKVWKDGMLGSRTVVDVPEEKASYKHNCSIMGMWWCSFAYAEFREDGKTIFTSNSGMLKLPVDVATLENNKMTVNAPLVKTPPFELKNGEANYMVEALGQKQQSKNEYNSKCSVRQAALGTALLIGK